MHRNTKIYLLVGFIAVSSLCFVRVWSKYNTKKVAKTTQLSDILPAEFGPIMAKRQHVTASRFSTIASDRDVVKNELDFWGRQLAEHALFLHLGLEDALLKPQALKIHKKLEAAYNNLTLSNLEEMLPVIQELHDFTVTVLGELNNGKWLGWVFPSLARHYIVELDYCMDKVNGIPYTADDEITFWNFINGDHAGTTAHLLDPSQKMRVKQAEIMAQKFEDLPKTEHEFLMQLSLTAAHELDEYNRNSQAAAEQNQVKSIIHPVLLDHMIREGQRSIDILNALSRT